MVKQRKVKKPTPTLFDGKKGSKFKDAAQKKEYIGILKKRTQFPRSSADAESLSNKFLAKKYNATVGEIEKINSALIAKNPSLNKYAEAKLSFTDTKRKGRFGIVQGGKRFSGIDGFQFHHIMPIGGNIDLTTKDVAFINRKMNSIMSPYNKILNNLADQIEDQPYDKNGLKKIEELNVKAAKEIDKARMKLPKKFQGLIGFNQIIPITDEYGTVINTDVKRIGIDEAKTIGGVKVPKVKLKDLKSGSYNTKSFIKMVKTNSPFHTELMKYCGKGKNTGGSAGVCSIEEATDGLKNALTKSKGNPAQMSKFKNILKTGGKYFGWVDAPIELAFALPGLLKGDKDEALRATSLGLFGAGRSELEKLDPKSPAYKTAKGKQDVKDYLKNYFIAQDLEKKLNNPKLDKVNEEYLTNLYNETVDKVDKVKSEYVPFTLQDEVAANKQIRDQEKKEADKGFKQPDGSLATSNYAKDLDLSNAYDYFKYKGDPGYNRNKVAAEELGLDNFYGDFTGKELEDRYSDLPTNIASSVGAAEKKQVDELMRKKLLEKGLDLSDNRISKYGIRTLKGTPNFLGFATGGIASLTKTVAPKKGPESEGLAYFMKRGKK